MYLLTKFKLLIIVMFNIMFNYNVLSTLDFNLNIIAFCLKLFKCKLEKLKVILQKQKP